MNSEKAHQYLQMNEDDTGIPLHLKNAKKTFCTMITRINNSSQTIGKDGKVVINRYAYIFALIHSLIVAVVVLVVVVDVLFIIVFFFAVVADIIGVFVIAVVICCCCCSRRRCVVVAAVVVFVAVIVAAVVVVVVVDAVLILPHYNNCMFQMLK